MNTCTTCPFDLIHCQSYLGSSGIRWHSGHNGVRSIRQRVVRGKCFGEVRCFSHEPLERRLPPARMTRLNTRQNGSIEVHLSSITGSARRSFDRTILRVVPLRFDGSTHEHVRQWRERLGVQHHCHTIRSETSRSRSGSFVTRERPATRCGLLSRPVCSSTDEFVSTTFKARRWSARKRY